MRFSVARADGRPRYKLPGGAEATVPCLAYSAGTCLGHVVETLLLSAAERCHFDRSFDTHMSEALKAMVLEGHGLGWLSESGVGRDLADGRLVPAGPAQWSCTLGVRLRRAADTISAGAAYALFARDGKLEFRSRQCREASSSRSGIAIPCRTEPPLGS